MTKVTKTSVTLSVMAANGDKSMDEVVPMILEAQHAAGFIDVTLKICDGAYRWAVRNEKAPGSIPAKTVKVKTEKVKTKKVKTKKEAVAKIKEGIPSSKEEKPVETKSAEEIERIKAANLERIKEVAKKFKKEKEVEKENEVEENYEQPLDSFAAPAFLTRREVEILV